ncbi:hypothetical protein SALBM135S_03484 [Streptomyces alboniger]
MQDALRPDPCLQIDQALPSGSTQYSGHLPDRENRRDQPQDGTGRSDPSPGAVGLPGTQGIARPAVLNVRHGPSALPPEYALLSVLSALRRTQPPVRLAATPRFLSAFGAPCPTKTRGTVAYTTARTVNHKRNIRVRRSGSRPGPRQRSQDQPIGTAEIKAV